MLLLYVRQVNILEDLTVNCVIHRMYLTGERKGYYRTYNLDDYLLYLYLPRSVTPVVN